MEKVAFSHITFGYEGRLLFENASLNLHLNQLNILVGQSGVGKTTLLEILAKRIEVSGMVCSDAKYQNISAETLASDYIAYHLVYAGYMDNLTVKQNIDETAIAFHNEKMASQLIDIFHFNDLLSRYPHRLSGGQKRILAVMLSLLRDLPIVLLDEPTSSLDQNSKERFLVFLKDYVANGHTVLLATNDDDVSSYADHILQIENRKIVDDEKSELGYLKKNEGHHEYAFKTILHHQWWQKVCLMILIMFSSVFLGHTICKNGMSIWQDRKFIDEESTTYENTMYCFYPTFVEAAVYFPFAKVMPESFVEEVQTIAGVDKIYPYYTIPLGATQDSGNKKLGEFVLRFDDGKTIDTTDEEVFLEFYYPEQRADSGIYMSEAFLAQHQHEITAGNSMTVTMALPVGVAQGTVAQTFLDENGEEIEVLLDTISKEYQVEKRMLTLSGTHHQVSSLYLNCEPLLYASYDQVSNFLDIDNVPTNAYVLIINEDADIEKIKEAIYAKYPDLTVFYPALEERLTKESLRKNIQNTYLNHLGMTALLSLGFVAYLVMIEYFNKKDRIYLSYSGLSLATYRNYRVKECLLLTLLTIMGAVIYQLVFVHYFNIVFIGVSLMLFMMLATITFDGCLRLVNTNARNK